MREIFTQELETLADDLTALGKAAVDAITRATQALLTNDRELAEKVIANDAHLNATQINIDKRAVELLALQNPVAQDLRVVVASLKMSVALERMGDLARHVASQVRIRYPETAVHPEFHAIFERMGNAARRVGEAMVELLSTPGLTAVPMIAAFDEELDTLHLEVFTKIGQLSNDQINPAQIADITLLSRYFERFGDQAVNVADRVEYMLSGNWGDSDARN